jgi:hypothetical protein
VVLKKIWNGLTYKTTCWIQVTTGPDFEVYTRAFVDRKKYVTRFCCQQQQHQEDETSRRLNPEQNVQNNQKK